MLLLLSVAIEIASEIDISGISSLSSDKTEPFELEKLKLVKSQTALDELENPTTEIFPLSIISIEIGNSCRLA